MSRFSSLYPSSQNSGSAFRPRHSGPPPFRPFFPRPPLIPGGFGPRTYRGRGLRPGGFHNQTYTRNYDADASYVDPYTEVDSANFTGTDNTNEHYTESEYTNLKSTETEKIAVIDYCHGAVSDVEDYRPQNTRVYGRARGYGVSRVHRLQAHLHEQRGRGVGQTNPETHNYEETERADKSYEETATLSNEQSVFPANRGRVTLQHPPSLRESHSNDTSQNNSGFVKQSPVRKTSVVHTPTSSNQDIGHQSSAVTVSSPAIINQSPSQQQSQLSSDHQTSSSNSSVVPMSSIQSSIVQSPTSKSTGPQRGPAVTVSDTVGHNLPVSRPLPPQGTSVTTSKNLSASVNVKNSNSETLNTCMSKSTVSSSSKENDNILATTSGSNPTSQNELISSSTQSLATNAKTSTSIIKPRYEIMSHSYRLPNNSPQSKCGPMLSGPRGPMLSEPRGPMLSEPRGPMPAKISQHDTTPHIQPDVQYSVAHNTQSPITYTTVNSTTSEEKIDNSEDEEEDSDEEVDTGYCQFCNVTFTHPDSYWRHTRGMLHTQRLMEAETKKKKEGDKLFETESVDAGPQFIKRDIKGKKVLSREEQQQSIRHELNFPRITKERSDEEVQEYDFNKSNWMDVDVKVPAKDRDLNPEDVGREQFPDEFYCSLCDVRCTGSVTFKMHVEGSKHKQKVTGGKKLSTPSSNFKTVPCDRPAKLVKSLDSIREPVIGLQYITEFQKKDEKIAPRYVCNLCEAKCDGNSILSHVIGIKHRIHYFKEHYPETHHRMQLYTSRKKSEQNGFAEEFARDIEFREGRQDVKVKMEIDICTELAAADLIKSGALDHLLEGTGFTRENLQKLDVESLKLTESEAAGEKVKIMPVCKPVEERLPLLPVKREDDHLLPGRREDDRLLPVKREDDRLLPVKREDDRLLPGKREDDRLLPGRRPEDRLYPMYYYDNRLLDDRIPQRKTDDYFRGRALDRDRYDEDVERMRRRRLHEIMPDDPYYSRTDSHYRPPEYPDPYYPPSRVVKDVQIKPVIVMDYGHSKKPVEQIRTGLTEEERSFMKRKSEGPKTDEELFHEFLKWKKSKTDTTDTKDEQEDNYQSETTTAVTPTQPMELPSCTTSDQSTKEPEGKNVNIAAMTTPNQVDVPPQVQELMSTLSKSMIHTEDEAAMALQVSNALTQALLQYQLKNISKELQDTVQQKQQNVSAVQQQPTGKAEAKKPSMKKQRFDAYSMIDRKIQKAVTSSKTEVTSSKSSILNSAVESKTQKISDSSLKKVQTSTQNINAPQNVMTLNPSVFQVSQRMMTSSEYAIPQPSVASAQRLMMSSQTMMTSLSIPGVQQSGCMNYNYMAMNQSHQFRSAYNVNSVQGVPPPMNRNQMHWNQPVPPQVWPPLPLDNPDIMPPPPPPSRVYRKRASISPPPPPPPPPRK